MIDTAPTSRWTLRALVLCAALAPTLALAATPPPGKPDTTPLKGKSVTELIGSLKDCESLETCPAVRELISRGPGIWPEAKVGLDAGEDMTRFWTLGVLSELQVPGAWSTMGELLAKDKHFRVRAAAAFALGTQRDKRVTPHLLAGAKDKQPGVRFAVAIALGRVKDPAGIPTLEAMCRDRDAEVREYAALALGDIGDKQAVPALLERLEQDAKARVRARAAMALGVLRDARSVAPLTARLKEETMPKPLAAALFALGEVGDASTIGALEAFQAGLDKHKNEPIRKSEEVREYLGDALAKLRKRAARPTPSK